MGVHIITRCHIIVYYAITRKSWLLFSMLAAMLITDYNVYFNMRCLVTIIKSKLHNALRNRGSFEH